MSRRTDSTRYVDAQKQFSPARLGKLFDGNREYPRLVARVSDPPRTATGKVDRKIWRERERFASPRVAA